MSSNGIEVVFGVTAISVVITTSDRIPSLRAAGNADAISRGTEQRTDGGTQILGGSLNAGAMQNADKMILVLGKKSSSTIISPMPFCGGVIMRLRL